MASDAGSPDAVASNVSTTSSPLLALPPELRNRTYSLALAGLEVRVDGAALASYAALLQTCKRIKHEATSIFYAENSFRLVMNGNPKHIRAAANWTRSLGSDAIYLRRLCIDTELSDTAADKIFQCSTDWRGFAADSRSLRAAVLRVALEDAKALAAALAESVAAGLPRDALRIAEPAMRKRRLITAKDHTRSEYEDAVGVQVSMLIHEFEFEARREAFDRGEFDY